MASKIFQATLQLINSANSLDPNQEVDCVSGQTIPKELLYSQRMSQCLSDFAPEASEELQLAVHAQHLQRWQIPRSDFSQDRTGYLQWRRKLGQFHAQRCSELMEKAGYEAEAVTRVSDLLQKKDLTRDSEAQTLEDVACLVFIRFHLNDFAPQYEEGKLISIIQKTWRKMSSQAQEKALTFDLPDDVLSVVGKALKSS